MSVYRFRFNVPAEIDVVIDGDFEDEDDAYNEGADRVEEHLSTLAVPSASGVVVHLSIDGVGGDRVDDDGEVIR